MTSLRPLVRLVQLAYYRWAAREMGPLHPDLPEVIHRLNQLERET